MSLGLLFWILMLLWVLGYGWAWQGTPWPQRAPGLLMFFIILVLGWHAFGAPIHG